MLFEHQYQFSKRMQMHDITEIVKQDIDHCHIDEGIVVVYTPHTTKKSVALNSIEINIPEVSKWFALELMLIWIILWKIKHIFYFSNKQ